MQGVIHAALPSGIIRAAEVSAASEEMALIIYEGKRIVFQRYAAGYSISSVFNARSITKSLCALGILQAQHEGILSHRNTFRSIPITEFLHQTSGLANGYESLYSRRLKSKKDMLAKLPILAPVGTSFDYGPAHYEALADMLETRLGSASASENYIYSRILRPLHISSAGWRKDSTGSPFFSAGLIVTPHSMLRLGTILLENGRLGFSQVFPRTTMQEIRRGSIANPAYSVGFWLNTNSRLPDALSGDVELAIPDKSQTDWTRFCLSRCAPADLIALVGSGGQRTYIIPSRKVVIVRFGQGKKFRDDSFLDAFFRIGKK